MREPQSGQLAYRSHVSSSSDGKNCESNMGFTILRFLCWQLGSSVPWGLAPQVFMFVTVIGSSRGEVGVVGFFSDTSNRYMEKHVCTSHGRITTTIPTTPTVQPPFCRSRRHPGSHDGTLAAAASCCGGASRPSLSSRTSRHRRVP